MTRTDFTKTPAKGTIHDHGESSMDRLVAALTTRIAMLEDRHRADMLALDAIDAQTVSDLALLSARVAALEPVSEWREVFYDGFGMWDPSKYFVYPASWGNTNGTGKYGAQPVEGPDGLRIPIGTDSTGTPRIFAMCPLPEGSLSDRGDLLGMRVSFRLRADRMPGYKGVPLLWPMKGHDWPQWGEIDGPEGSFDRPPSAFVHPQNGAADSSDQTWFPYPAGTSWQDWHEYATEWDPGKRVAYYLDGALVGAVIDRVPEGPMHLVMQFETNLTPTKPDPAVSGFVELDWLRVEVRNA